MNSIFSIALTLFIITNPIGNSPAIIAQIKDFSFERQRIILFREIVIAYLLALFFQFFGQAFLTNLHLQNYSVSMSGGIILLIVAIKMIFPLQQTPLTAQQQQQIQEPFIVPIATPLLSGAGLLSIILLFSQQENNDFKMVVAITIAWIGVAAIVLLSPYIQKLFGRRGLIALEQLMGMLLSMMSMEMIVKGVALLTKEINTGQ